MLLHILPGRSGDVLEALGACRPWRHLAMWGFKDISSGERLALGAHCGSCVPKALHGVGPQQNHLCAVNAGTKPMCARDVDLQGKGHPTGT